LHQARYDDWRELFRSVDRIEKVSKADIRRVANKTFTSDNRTVGIIESTGGPPPAGAAAQGGGQ
jgi:predicted Zn-dependent peptidase